MRALVAIAAIAALAVSAADSRAVKAQRQIESQDAQASQGLAPNIDYSVEPTDRMMELTTNANMRAGPSKTYDILEVARIGARLHVTGKVRERNWVRVEFSSEDENAVAYVYAPLLRELHPDPPTRRELEHGPAQPAQESAPSVDRASVPDESEAESVNSATNGSVADKHASLLSIAKIGDPAANDHVVPPTENIVVVENSQFALTNGDVGLAHVYPASIKEPKPQTLLQPHGPDWSIAENQPCQVWNYGTRGYEPFRWSGDCVEGRASGDGWLVFRGGEGVYEGAMRAGKMHGHGVLTWSDGFRYEGELREGKQHGMGTLFRPTGERYDGRWQQGKPHGHGVYIAASGEIYEGAWREGCYGAQVGRRAWFGTEPAACGFQ